MPIPYIKLLGLYVFWIVLLFPVSACAQVNEPAPQLPFVQYQANQLKFPGDSSAMLAFYQKMDSLYKGQREKITIAHYGGSHIQAGFWTEQMHKRFQASGTFKGGGNFAFPFTLASKNNGPHFFSMSTTAKWKGYRCVNYQGNLPLGMAGAIVCTHDEKGEFSIRLDTLRVLKKFNRILVYHNFQSDWQFEPMLTEANPMKREDKHQEGYSQFDFQFPIDSLSFHFSYTGNDTNHLPFVLNGFSLENAEPGFYYAPMGVNGASTSSFLKCDSFSCQLKSIPPDLIIFSLGVNDVHGPNFNKDTFMLNYDSIISRIKSASPNASIIFTTISDNYIRVKTSKRRSASVPNKRSLIVQEAIYELAKKHNAAVWDLFQVMGGLKSIIKWNKVKLAKKDKVHFTPKGYIVVGDLMYEAIMKSYHLHSTIPPK